MINYLVSGIGVGIGTFYLTHVLVQVNGWVTVNRLLLYAIAPKVLDTSDDIIGHVSINNPHIAELMGCQYCMAFWFNLLFTICVSPYLLTWLTSLGITGMLLTYFEYTGPR